MSTVCVLYVYCMHIPCYYHVSEDFDVISNKILYISAGFDQKLTAKTHCKIHTL